MKIYCIVFCALLSIIDLIHCQYDCIPVLFWASPDIPEGPALELGKINCKLFTNYLINKLSGTKAVVLVFMVRVINENDLHWRTEKSRNYRPSFTILKHRIKIFPCVEHPHEALKNLAGHGYKIEYVHTEWKSNVTDSSVVIMEFRGENTFGEHYELMAAVTMELMQMRNNWICIYTARQAKGSVGKVAKTREPFIRSSKLKGMKGETDKSDFPRGNSWQVAAEQHAVPRKSLYLYADEVLGLAMMTKGPIQLHLPSHTNYTIKYLENHGKGVSFTSFKGAMDLVVWFTNYTLTFSMSSVERDWFIDWINIQKEDGQSLKLWPRIGILNEDMSSRFSMFQSKGKAIVKLLIPRYKIVNIYENENSCVSKFTASVLCTIMFSVTACVSAVCSILLYVYRIPISPRSKNYQDQSRQLSIVKWE